MIHSFNVEVAKQYSLNEAVFLYNLCFWQQKNIANNKHFYDGKYWSYNSTNAFQKLFPYFTAKQVRTVIEKLVDKGVLYTGNYNKIKMDRTKWYSVSDEVMTLHGFTDHLTKTEQHLPTEATPFDQEGKAIPYNKPIINTDNNISSVNDKIDEIYSFDDFWNAYGKKVGFTACRKKYYKLSIADIKKIKDSILRYVADTPDPKFRKNPQTYLNQSVWNDYTDCIPKVESATESPLEAEPYDSATMSKIAYLIDTNNWRDSMYGNVAEVLKLHPNKVLSMTDDEVYEMFSKKYPKYYEESV